MSDIYQRKREHLALCLGSDVEAGSSFFDEVRLIHNALPELAMAQLDLRTPFLNHSLSAPVMVTGMTGGPAETGLINQTLAQVCERLGLAFGVGSQRVMLKANCDASFQVRSVAPDVVLVGNLGVNQVHSLGVSKAVELMKRIQADYLAVHLNPAQELAQPGSEADSDFRGGYAAIARLVEALDGRVIVKECGTGLSPQVVRRLKTLGVLAVDVSGRGGTSWVKVEAMRAKGGQAELGHLFADWGIPTAAATAAAAGIGPLIIASGGVGNGLDAVRALALGADVVGCARPVLQAYDADGEAGVERFLHTLIQGIRMGMALTGCHTPPALRTVPKMIGPRLQRWIDTLTALEH